MLQLYVTVLAKATDANERRKMKVITILATSGSDIRTTELWKMLAGTCRPLRYAPDTFSLVAFPTPLSLSLWLLTALLIFYISSSYTNRKLGRT